MVEKVPKKLGQRHRKHTTLVFGSKQQIKPIEESSVSGKDSVLTKKGIANKKAQPSRSNMENNRGHKAIRGQPINSKNRTMKMDSNNLLEEDEDSDNSFNMKTPEPPVW